MAEYLKDLMEKTKKKAADGTVGKITPAGAEVFAVAENPPTRIEEKLKALEKEPEKKQAAEAVEKPAASQAAFEEAIGEAKKTEVAAYGNVKVFKVEGKPMLLYFVPVPRPTAAEKTTINTIKEAATRLISIAPYKIRDPQQRRNVYYQKIMEILKGTKELNIPEARMGFYAEAVVREMVGYGIIDDLIRDDKLEEIMVIGPQRPVYVFHREFEMMETNIAFFSDNEIQDLVNRIARDVGRRVDISSPLLDARLPDGSRVNATIPPASVSGSTLTIRKFRADPYSIVDLVNYNTLSTELAAFLWMAVEGMGVSPANMLIAGGTGSGKTTMLNVLASFVPATERIVSIEDTSELNLPMEHWIRLEARPPGLEGKGELTLDILTKNSLRMRPDRILVGEIRHDEAFTLFTAMNTGHNGCMGTVHANSAQETVVRITSPPMSVPEIMLAGLDLVIIEQRIHDRQKGTIRRITDVAEVSGTIEGKTQVQTIFERDPVADTVKRASAKSRFLAKIEKFTGLTTSQVEAEIAQRKALLDGLVKRGERSMAAVSKAMQDYLSSRQARA